MRILTGLATMAALAMTAAAAWALPTGVTEKAGAWVAPDGKPLYTFARDTTPGKSACNGPCATAWPPLAAAADAHDDGDWTVITRDDGSHQWAYKGHPLYTFARDTAGAAATGVSAAWPLAMK
jgi:predicted lipoprotein with Yx(FWY)xxD motif